jgi:CxxC motif-containing protein
MIRELTCIVCPKGCQLKVTLDDNNAKKVLSVEGHTCKRGEKYANDECVAPMRTLTTTAAVVGGGVVPVKTDRTIPKELMFECMRVINAIRVPADAKLGDVIIENVLGTGANVVTTRNVQL